ncbi:hypothetical protein DL96DRAFT_1607936 [Flagelloscypha sp. PMI_526]|nr:hypothetical protein DL96DRAFT_1607936 [Flagelloscypha sp. PMI_526]
MHFYLSLLSLLPLVSAGSKYLDDADPAWTFTGSWNTVSLASPCTGCAAQGSDGTLVDVRRTHDLTYHDGGAGATANQGGTIKFTGNSIEVYGIEVNMGGAITFSLPGTPGGRYEGPGVTTLKYSTLMFQAKGLPEDQEHTLTFALETASTGGQSTLLDVAVIGFTDPVTTSSTTPATSAAPATSGQKTQATTASAHEASQSSEFTSAASTSAGAATAAAASSTPSGGASLNVGALVGGVLGGLAFILIILGCLGVKKRQNMKAAAKPRGVPEVGPLLAPQFQQNPSVHSSDMRMAPQYSAPSMYSDHTYNNSRV